MTEPVARSMNCKLLNMTTKKVLKVDLLVVNASPTQLCFVVNGQPTRQLCGFVCPSSLVLVCTCLPPLVVKVVGCVLVPHGGLVVLAGCLRCLARPLARNLPLVLEAADTLFPKRRAQSSSCSVTPCAGRLVPSTSR